MLGLLSVFFIYSVAITVAVIVITIEKDKYYRKFRALEDELKRIKSTQPAAPSQAQTPAVTPSQVPTQSVPVQTPAPAMQPQAQPQQVFKPAPAPVPAPLPVYTQKTQSPAHQKKSGLTAVGVSFSVGVLLMVIAAAVFISATWQTMPAVVKCIVLLIVVSGVYGLSTLCRKKLKLEKTSSVLYMLASLITPLAIFVGFLAFGAEDSMFTLVCCAVSLGVSGFVGYKTFGSKLQVAISYLGFVWSEIFLCMQVLGNTKGMAFGMCAAAFISGLIYFLRPKLKFFDVFAEVSAYVAVIGLVMTSAFGKYSLPLFIASHILYWVTLLMLTRKRKWIAYVSALVPVFTVTLLGVNYIEGRTGFMILVLIMIAFLLAFYRIIKHENLVSNLIICVGMSLLTIIMDSVTRLNNSGDYIRDFMHYTTYLVPILTCGAVYIMTKNKFERALYTYFIVASAIVECQIVLQQGIVPIIIFLALAALSIIVNCKYKMIHLKIASCAAAVIVYIINFSNGDTDLNTIVYASAAIALYAFAVLINKFGTVEKITHISTRFSLLPLLIISNLMLLILDVAGSLPCFIVLIVIDVIFTALTLLDTDNYFGCLPAVTFMTAVMLKLVQSDVDKAVVSIIFIAVYALVGRFICRTVVSKTRIDWFTFLAAVACMVPVSDLSFTLLFMTFYIMTFTGRFGKEGDTLKERLSAKFRLIVSCAIGSLTLCLVTLDMDFSSVADTEIRLMFMLVAALAIYLFILHCDATKWIWFSTVALSIEIEAFHAMEQQQILPLTLISVCAVGIFIYSFIFKKRSWFILAIGTIGEFALLFAIVFWDSRLWWIYLLVLGGILIVTASVNEYKRRKAVESGMEDKKVRLFDDWSW